MDKCPLLSTTPYLGLWSLSVLRAKMLGTCMNNSRAVRRSRALMCESQVLAGPCGIGSRSRRSEMTVWLALG